MKKSVVLRSEDGSFGDYIVASSNEKELAPNWPLCTQFITSGCSVHDWSIFS